MNLRTISSSIKCNLSNIPGWRTNRKIVVIESDDWGSIRMPSKEVYQKLLKAGIRVDKCPYNRYDALASEEDLSLLFETLTYFKDEKGNHPIITANSVVANPDFEKIKAANYKEYHFELFTETLKKYPEHVSSFDLWKHGMEAGVFYPQFHGREHLNVMRWMNALRSSFPETRIAFDHNLFGISTTITSEKRRSYLEALDFDNIHEKNLVKKIVSEGLMIFKQIFGFASKSFVAPNYVWSPDIEPVLSKGGVKYIQSQRVQKSPIINSRKKKKVYHVTGQKNRYDQIYTIRNCQFEPCFSQNRDAVSECLAQIKNSFRWGKPAIIISHRANYIGFIEESNRDNNLQQLKQLITQIQKKWPMTEFFSTVQLGELISTNN